MKEPAEKALSELVTPELFAEYIGKTPAAIRKMATAGKLPVIRMKDPLNPSKKGGEIYIHRGNGMLMPFIWLKLPRLNGMTGRTVYSRKIKVLVSKLNIIGDYHED